MLVQNYSMEVPEQQTSDPLASSPIFAALIHAASCAKDEKPRRGGLRGVPLPDVDSIGESQEEEEFELNHYSGEEETAVSGRGKRNTNGSSASGYNNQHKRRWEEPKRVERSIRQRSRPEKAESNAKGNDDSSGVAPGVKGGSSCHQCKSRRMFQDLTYCTSSLENKKKTCRKKYCEHCLTKFYNEPPLSRRDKAHWVCPSCRRICCCAACRRKELKQGGGAISAASSAGSSSRSGNVVEWERELASRKQNGRDSRSVPMDYDAVLDLEELRLMAIAQETNANTAAEDDLPVALDDAADEGPKSHRSFTPSDDSANPGEATDGGHEISQQSPPLRCTVAYMLAIAQFGSVKEMLRRIVSRRSVGPHEKVQLISVLLRRIHQKYAALGRQKFEPAHSF